MELDEEERKVMLARLAEVEASIAERKDEAGLARRFAAASDEEAIRIMGAMYYIHTPGPVLEDQLCRMVDRGEAPLRSAIFDVLFLGFENEGLLRRAIAALDDPSPRIRSDALSSLPRDEERMAARVDEKLPALATHTDSRVRLALAYTFGVVRPLLVLPMLDDVDDEVRYGAAMMPRRVPQYPRLAYAAALRLVHDSGARPSIRCMSADTLGTEEERRAAHHYLARIGFEGPHAPDKRFASDHKKEEPN